MSPTEKLFSISECAEALGSSVQQLKKWERQGVMPPPSARVQRGSRWDRAYTEQDIEEMRRLRSILRAGAPTAEEAEERERRRAVFQTRTPQAVPASGRLGG